MEQVQTPGTYQQWLELLGQMEKSRNPAPYAAALQQGTLRCPEQVRLRMEERVLSAVNTMLRRTTRWYTRKINEALEDGDYACLTVQFYRLRRDLTPLRFYRNVSFLSGGFAAELDRQVLSETARYWDHLLSSLKETASETHNSLLEEELLQIQRIRLDKDAH